MQYVIKEFEPGESHDFKLHVVDDDHQLSSEDSLWCWIKRAARSRLEISVYALTKPAKTTPRPWVELLLIDTRQNPSTLETAYADSAEQWQAIKGQEGVFVREMHCVLDLS